MSTTAITAAVLALNTLSNDLAEAGGGSANGIVPTTAADGWVISGFKSAGRCLMRLSVTTADTFVVVAGDRPPSQMAAIGNLSLALSTSDTRYIVVELARFLQDDGTVLVTCGLTSSALAAFFLPLAG